MTKKQLDEKIEDDLDLEDDDWMQEYQAQRIAELKEKANQHRFTGGMIDITKADYQWHTENMPADTKGIILMYQDQ